MAGEPRVSFSQGDAQRISAATLAYERGNRDMPAIRFRQPGDGGGAIRVGKVSQDWSVGTCTTVNIWEDGSGCEPTNSNDTVEDVANLTMKVSAGSWVFIGQAANGRWYLLAAGNNDSCKKSIGGQDVSSIDGHDSAKTQVLGHDANGCLKWIDTTPCDPPPEGGGQ